MMRMGEAGGEAEGDMVVEEASEEAAAVASEGVIEEEEVTAADGRPTTCVLP